MIKLFVSIFCFCICSISFLNANVISYDPSSGTYVVDQFGAPVQIEIRTQKKSKPSLAESTAISFFNKSKETKTRKYKNRDLKAKAPKVTLEVQTPVG